MIARLCLIALALGASTSAFAQPAAPCACINSTSTDISACTANAYAPALSMFGRYKPASNVTYHIASSDADMDLRSPSGALDPNQVRNIIQQSANTWNNAPCCCTEFDASGGCAKNANPASKPNIQLVRAPGEVQIPANGKEPSYNYVGGVDPLTMQVLTPSTVVKRIWVAKDDYDGTNIQFHDLPGLLAITIPYPSATEAPDYKLLRTRMVINGGTALRPGGIQAQVYWFLSTNPGGAGCTGANYCYSLQQTVTHEFGHFIGYNHSACQKSVMTDTASPNSATHLSLHETDVKSLCASGADAQLVGNGYGKSAACGAPAPTGASGATGSTDVTNTVGRYNVCDADSDCVTPLKCVPSRDAKYCDLPCTKNTDCPGNETCPAGYCTVASGPSAATGSTGGLPVPDFCAPCERRGDCANAVCVALNDTVRICSAYCSTNAQCGSSAKCSALTMGDEGVCIPIDMSCVASAAERRGQLNEVCGTNEPCGPGLICVQLPGSPVCLEYCDSDSARPEAKGCTNDGQGCYELDSDMKFGACFKANMREGESCLLGDTSACGLSGKMKCTFLPGEGVESSACYKLCGGTFGNTCGEGQSCTQGAAFGVCAPLPKNLCPLAEYGEKCLKGEDCSSGFCTTRGGAQACSRTCSLSLQSGCPKDFSCLEAGAGDRGFCWPDDNQVEDPKPCTAGKTAGCGGCSSSTFDWQAGLALAFLVLMLRAKGKR